MISGNSTRKRHSRLHNARGYSLVELTVAIGVAMVVGLGIYAIFNYSQKSSRSSRVYNDLQTSCGFAMEQMKSELLLAGYRAVDEASTPSLDESKLPIINAASNAITFQYLDENARDEPPYDVGFKKNSRVTYSLVAGNLIRQVQRYTTAGDFDTVHVTSQTLAANIEALDFGYFAQDNAAWNGVDPREIRTIRPTLVCNASRPDPNTQKIPQITLVAEVRARNVGVSSVPTDTVPPAAPTGLIAWDPGSCGILQLRWNANTEADLEGYKIYYGLASGSYSGRVSITRPPGTGSSPEFYTLTGLDSAVTGVTPPQYYIAISAYDKAGNVSVSLSAETSGNPTTSSRTVAEAVANGTDTTPTPTIPAAPVAFTATPGANSVNLTWTTSPATGLRGYRLYREPKVGAAADAVSSAAFTPDDTPVDGNRLKDYLELLPDQVSFTDTGLQGCKEYFYKIAAVACDTALPVASLQFSTASAIPTDTVRPSSPKLVARPGYKRIILNLENPTHTGTDTDFTHSRIWFSTSSYPTINEATGVVSGGAPIPDAQPYPGTPGTYTGTGTIFPPINFNDIADGSAGNTAPHLTACTNQAAVDEGLAACDPITYYFLAVAFDRCNNSSHVTEYSISEGTQCGDCNVGEACYGAPPAPTGLTSGGCSSTDGIQLSWDEYDVTTYRDLAGFHIWRCEDVTCASGGTELTQGTPTWFTEVINTNASTFPVVDGVTYSYRIEASDCYYERRAGVTTAERAVNNPDDNSSSTTINALSVGMLDRDSSAPQIVTGYLPPSTTALPFTESAADGLTSVPPTFQHNTVSLWTKNTAASNLTLQSFTASWENPQAFLQQVAFGDGTTTPVTVGWKDTASPLTHSSAGSTMSAAANSRFLAGDTRIPFVTSFRNADGSVTRETDVRQDVMNYTLTYRNESTGSDGCGVTGWFFVPLGPYVYGTSQDQPSAGTRAWAVPGDEGGSAMNVVIAEGGSKVTVFTNVFDSSGAGLAAVKLYYYVDTARTLTAPPAIAPTAQYPSFAPYTAVDLVPVAGNQWSTPTSPVDRRIPVNDDSNVWFFIVAVDGQGNWDRDPEIGAGGYQYFQRPADVCANTPNPPSLAGTVSGSDVILTWTAPTTNTNDTTYADGKGYEVFRDAGLGWTLLTTIADKNTLTYTDAAVPAIDTLTYRYQVKAVDLCTPTANRSAESNTFTESLESPCNTTPNPPVLSGITSATGESVTLSWTAPATNTSGSPCIDLVGYQIWRKKDLGAWTLYKEVPQSTLFYSDSGLVDIGISDYQYQLRAVDSCTPEAKVSLPSNTYIDQITTTDPCTTIPGLVTGLTVTAANSTVGVALAWQAPTTQSSPDGWPYNDGGGFRIRRAQYNNDNTPVSSATVVDSTPADVTTWTDSSVASTVGNFIYRYWVIAFDTCNKEAPTATGPVTESFTDPCAFAPPGPGTLTVTAADGTGVSLSWVAPSPNPGDLAGYQIERRSGTTGAWVQVAGSPIFGAATTFKDTSATNAGSALFFYRVRAFDTCATPNVSVYSNEAMESFTDLCLSIAEVPTTPALAITGVTPGNCNTASTSVAVTWNGPNPTADLFYRIYRCFTNTDTPDCTPEEIFTTTEPPSPAQLTKAASIDTGGIKPNSARIWVWVEAVSARSGCSPATWKTVRSSPVKDSCLP